LILVLIPVVIGGVIAWQLIERAPEAPKKPRRNRAVRLVAPGLEVQKDFSVEIEGYGTAEPKTVTAITPQVSGRVAYKAPDFIRGGKIEADQILLRIDTTDFDQAKRSAQAQIGIWQAQIQRLKQQRKNLTGLREIEAERIELIREQLDNARELLARDAASRQDIIALEESLLARRAALRQISNQMELIPKEIAEIEQRLSGARAELDKAQTALDRARIRSPVTGRVLSSNVEENVRIAVGQSCGEVFGTDVMEIPVSLSPDQLKWLEVERMKPCPDGLPTDADDAVRADVYWQDVKWTGCAVRVEAGLEAQTRAARVVVRVVNSAQPETRPLERNMFCRVVIRGRTLPEAAVIPRIAVHEEDEGHYIFAVSDGKLVRKPVRAARFFAGQALLLPTEDGTFGGLEPELKVVRERMDTAVVGMQVAAFESHEAIREALTNPAQTQADGESETPESPDGPATASDGESSPPGPTEGPDATEG
jgi:multidrug efflux pump subunit AcrA (membrane-fusion protein)